jgi:hypothetical protein
MSDLVLSDDDIYFLEHSIKSFFGKNSKADILLEDIVKYFKEKEKRGV